ncbi:MAG TPA: glycoside hydrolase family 36 protein, partial [Myxococcota bacterium]|nr:glycoside hydrolase family 36 protein [Myxococcota bacterium]
MAVTLRRDDSSVSLANERVRVRLDLVPCRLAVLDASGEVGFAGARVGACVDARPQPDAELAGTRVVASLVRDLACEDEVDTPLGRAARVRARVALAAGLELSLALELGSDWPGVALALELANTGPSPREIAGLEPFLWRGDGSARLALPGDPRALRFLALGHQSWSPARWLRLGERPSAPRGKLLRRCYASPYAPRPRRGRFVSESASALGEPERAGLALGFLSHSRWLGWLELLHEAGRIHELVARCAIEGEPLAPGATVASERLWLGIAAPVEEALGQWAERAGREMGAPVPARPLGGWCSWYRFGTRVRADDVRRNLRALRGLGAPVDVVQIDDGFQAANGDWLAPAAGFPDGLAPLAREIRAEGLRAGLWLAPFLASPRSRLAREHLEWLLRGADGRPLTALWNPAWPGARMHALDATHPGVESWLESLARELRALGFDYLKLDFLFAGALAGARHDPRAGGVAAYRRGIAALRRGAGPGVFLLGCGAPLGASIGLFEAMRIGADVAARWTNRAFDAVVGVEAGPAARNALRNVFARAPLHQRLWLNDPDCALLRPSAPSAPGAPMSGSKLGPAEVQTLAASIALCGGLVIVSDELDELTPDGVGWLRRLLPGLRLAPRTGPARGPVPDSLCTRFDDGSALWLRVNLGEKPEPVELDPRALGFSGPLRVWDVLEARELACAGGRVALGQLAPHAARLLRLVPDEGRARVLGTTLHVAAGALETESVALDPAGVARVRLRLPGSRAGEIALALPGEPRLARAHVSFDDALELRLRVGV